MSVGVKQPTQFQHPEFPCGELKNPPQPNASVLEGQASISDGEGKSASNLAPPMRTRSRSVNARPPSTADSEDARRQQAFRRRRFSSHSHLQQRHERGGQLGQQIRRRRHSAKSDFKEKIVLPTKFLLGGNINDPLNLNGLPTDDPNQQTPVSSPLATPAHRRLVNMIIPLDITDPLNLNCDDDEVEALIKQQKKKKRIKHHKKKDSSSSLLSDTSLQDTPKQDVTRPLSIQIDPIVVKKHDSNQEKDSDKDNSPQVIQNKIVSPVIPQISPKRRRKRTSSECRPDMGQGAARNIFREDSDQKGDTISPGCSANKYRRQHSSQSHEGQRSHQNQQQPQNKNPRHSNSGPKFIYGNYNRYYGYRNPEAEDDNRLKCLKKDWFEGKDVLDIGCNVGHITLAIARYFEPNKITGIDIDGKLIGAARRNIKYYLPDKDGEGATKFPASMKTCFGPITKTPVGEALPTKFPKNVFFKQANYVLEHDSLLEMQQEEYDVIIAFSVTKWIHFNWGDEGIKRFFRRIGKQLRPGGMLILEPQPWVSYKKKKKLTDTIFKNFQSIKFKPEHFRDYLLSSACGFRTCQFIDVPFNKAQGFRRPIQIYIKPLPFGIAFPIEGRYSPMTPATPLTPHFEQEPFIPFEVNSPLTPAIMPRRGFRRFSMPCNLMTRASWSSPSMSDAVYIPMPLMSPKEGLDEHGAAAASSSKISVLDSVAEEENDGMDHDSNSADIGHHGDDWEPQELHKEGDQLTEPQGKVERNADLEQDAKRSNSGCCENIAETDMEVTETDRGESSESSPIVNVAESTVNVEESTVNVTAPTVNVTKPTILVTEHTVNVVEPTLDIVDTESKVETVNLKARVDEAVGCVKGSVTGPESGDKTIDVDQLSMEVENVETKAVTRELKEKPVKQCAQSNNEPDSDGPDLKDN